MGFRRFCVSIVLLIVLQGGISRSYAAEEIIVSAAASLTNAMTEIGQAFQEERPGIQVIFNFAASGSLVQQMLHGAPVDVFASASRQFMDRAQREGLIQTDSRRNFSQNTLVLAVPACAEITLDDLAGLLHAEIHVIGIGHPDTVPAGRYAKEALEAAAMWETLVPKLVFGNSVRQVLDYLRRGEVDAGLIYATDAIIGGNAVRVVESIESQPPIVYPIALTSDSQKRESAQEFVDFIMGERGQAILKNFGFSVP